MTRVTLLSPIRAYVPFIRIPRAPRSTGGAAAWHERDAGLTRLLLILLAASFALTVLAVMSDDTVAERRTSAPAVLQQGAKAPAAPWHAAPVTAGLPAPAAT